MGGRRCTRLAATPVAALGLFPIFGAQGPPRTDPPQAVEQAALSVTHGRAARYNPVSTRVFPDPMVLRDGRWFYAYGTTTSKKRIFPILRSRDMVRWRAAGSAFRRPPGWSHSRWWAPSVMRRGRTYYLFYAAHARRPFRMCTAVATSSSPRGPFRHRARLACGGHGGSIDPAPLVDSRGRAWLYFARTSGVCAWRPGRCSIAVVRLRNDLLRTRGRPRHLLGIDLPWERTKTYAAIENPWVFERGGLYYLLYSANDWQGAYGMGYAVSRSPAGPFRKVESKPLLSGRSGLNGPGGGSTVVGPRGMMWLAYHARRQAPGYRYWRNRTLHIDPLLVNRGRLALQGPSVSSRIRP